MLPPQPRLSMMWLTPSLAVIVSCCIASPGCSSRPEPETKQRQDFALTVEAAKPIPSGADRPGKPDRDTKAAETDDPIGSLFGAALRVADKAATVATSGADEKSLQGFIEAAADGVRTGLDVADETLPPLDPGIARKFGDDFRSSVVSDHGRIVDRQPIELLMPIWDEVVRASREQPGSLTITLVEDPAINAFAFVGRNVVVNRGFIEFATGCSRPKDVIRFTLAHELGHIVCGHTDTLFRRVVAAEQVVPGAGVAPAIIESIVKQTPISQAAEREADCFARRMHLANGWSLEGGREFFTRVQRMSGRPTSGVAIESLFGSHPDESRRLDLLATGSGCGDE
jgi:predicted Zn-dependent protease